MKKLLSIILTICMLLPLCPAVAMSNDDIYVEDVYYNGDFDTDTRIETWVGNPVTDSSAVHAKVGPLVSDSDKVYSLYADTTKYGPTAEGRGQGTRFRYSFDAKWLGNFPLTDNATLFEFNYYKPDNSTDWYVPLSINSDGSLSTAPDVKLSLGKWYNFTYDVTFMENETNTIVTDITVTDEESGTKYVVAEGLERNNVAAFMNKHVIYRKGMGTSENAFIYVDNLKWARMRIPEPEFVFEPLCVIPESMPSGNKIKFAYTTRYCENILGDNGGYVVIYHSGTPVGDNYTDANSESDIVIEDGENKIFAKLFGTDGECLFESSEYTVNGISLSNSVNTPGYTANFDDDSRGAFNDSASKKIYSEDDPDPYRNQGKVAHGQWTASSTGNHTFAAQRPFNVSGTVNIPQGRFFEVSADIRSNASTNVRMFNLLNFTFNKTNPITDLDAQGWGVGMMVLATGEIACYSTGTGTGIYADLNSWHNYKIIFDTNPGGSTTGYYFIDDVLIHCQTGASANIRALQGLDIGVTYDGEKETDLYLDNVTLKTYDIPFNAQLDLGGRDAHELPYENLQPVITFSMDMNEESMNSIVLKTKDGTEIDFTGTYSSSDKTFTFDALNLAPDTEYVIDLSEVKTTSLAGGTQGLSFTTEKAPFSIRKIEEGSGEVTVTLNNRENEEKNAVLLVGYYDSDMLYRCSVREINCTYDRESFDFVLLKPSGDVWLEAYLVDFTTFTLIDKYIAQ